VKYLVVLEVDLKEDAMTYPTGADLRADLREALRIGGLTEASPSRAFDWFVTRVSGIQEAMGQAII